MNNQQVEIKGTCTLQQPVVGTTDGGAAWVALDSNVTTGKEAWLLQPNTVDLRNRNWYTASGSPYSVISH